MTATCRPGMLMVDVCPLFAQPALEYTELAGRLPALNLSP